MPKPHLIEQLSSGFLTYDTKRTIKKIRSMAEILDIDEARFEVGKYTFQATQALSQLERQYRTHLGMDGLLKLYREANGIKSPIIAIRHAGRLALGYSSAHFLEYREHRFIFGEAANDVSYSRSPFNVDCQAIGSQSLRLTGISQIAHQEDAHNELLWIAAELSLDNHRANLQVAQ